MEDDERKRERDDSVEHHLLSRDAKCEPLPTQPGVESVRQRPSHPLELERNKRDNPKGRIGGNSRPWGRPEEF